MGRESEGPASGEFRQRALSKEPRAEMNPMVKVMAIVAWLVPGLASSQTTPPPRESALASARASRFADSVLALMTLEEKVGQLTQATGSETKAGPRIPAGGEAQIRAGRVGSFLYVFGAEYTRRLQQIATTESRLKIPLLFAFDVIHGLRTIYPIPLAEAASFDPARVEFSAHLAAVEASAHGLHWTFAPMVDIARDPRWGRISEGAGEDPFLGRVMAAAKVRGFQGGADAQNLGAAGTVMATVKHFAAYGGAEGGRDYNTVDLSERTLWDTYLPPYEAAVKAGAAFIMSSFNDIAGRPAHASEWLLGDVLRTRWGFKGTVVSDWAGIEQLMSHGVAATKGEAAILALRAGVDVDMVDAVYADSLGAAVKAGRIPLSFVDTAVHRLLRLKFAMGLFQDPYRYTNADEERRYTLAPEHLAASRIAAREGIVLLKNANKTLPLRKDLPTIAVIGPLADDPRSALGNWSGAGKKEEATSVLAGIRAAVGSSVRLVYVRGAAVDTPDTTEFNAARAAASNADAVILVVGEREDMSGEASSRASIELPGSQSALAHAVLRAAQLSPGGETKPVVTVLMNGRPLAIPELAREMPAIVESWFLGSRHGNAVADVLFGDYNPAGKLPVSFPRATGQIPIYYSHRNTGRPPDSAEKYSSKYVDLAWTPLFPFGFGLSYTTFNYANLRVSAPSVAQGDSIQISVDLANTGDRAGEEVVELYIRDDVASVAPPVRLLKGFQRVSLQRGELRTISFKLGPEALSFYDQQMRRVVEPGGFTVFVGGSSDAVLQTKFQVTGDTLVLEAPTPRFR
ncbi:MAG: glycoside hydrolase family 3 N-terminal domain-containing protein [Gemmatimonadaceae bacterium]